MPFLHHIKNTQGYYGIALALLFLVVAPLILAPRTGTVMDRLTRSADMMRSDQAETAAKSLVQRGMLESRLNGVGYENPAGSDAEIADTNNDGVFDVWGDYEVWARAKKVGWRTGFMADPQDVNYDDCSGMGAPCVVPIPGTGNAGSECDFTDPSQDWAQPTTSPTTGLNNDCNWNKLHYGEVVSFPLYYEVDPTDPIQSACDLDGNGICNPAELGLGTFTLRVRTPNGEQLGWADASDADGPIVMNWEITGDCDTAPLPNGDGVADESCWMIGKAADPPPFPTPDSFINASDVNLVTSVGNEVVDESYYGEMHTGSNQLVLDFLTSDESGATNMEILNPLLTISVVTPLENAATLEPVPYLEYQIQTDKPISDAKISLFAVGYAQGKRGIYPWYQKGFFSNDLQSLIQFVIQN